MAFSSECSIIVVSCAGGVAPFVGQELTAMGFPVSWSSETAVETEGSLLDAMRLNLHLRTGHRVFYMLGGFTAYNPDELYERLMGVPWERYLLPDGYFTVDVSVDTPTIRNTQFAALKVKDAVADRMRERCGRRPDSGNRDEGAALFLHWVGRDAAIYINTSGGSLSRRGYRTERTTAPMRETLAAAVVMATGWKGQGHFVNPMCGGGTLAIEAGWIARNRAPGLLRTDFAFMHLRGFQMSAWRKMRQEAIASIKPSIPGRILLSDVAAEAVGAATTHIAQAGLEDILELELVDATLSKVPDSIPDSVLLLHPPYGARMGDSTKLRLTYAEAGAFLQRHSDGYRGFMFTGNQELADRVGLKVLSSQPFFNGQIECQLLEFDGSTPIRRGRVAEE